MLLYQLMLAMKTAATGGLLCSFIYCIYVGRGQFYPSLLPVPPWFRVVKLDFLLENKVCRAIAVSDSLLASFRTCLQLCYHEKGVITGCPDWLERMGGIVGDFGGLAHYSCISPHSKCIIGFSSDTTQRIWGLSTVVLNTLIQGPAWLG